MLYGSDDEDEARLITALETATDSEGNRTFTVPTCLSVMVFFVLAMQCLPTQAVTLRETKSWKWAAFQFGYMTVLAYGAALLAFQGLRLIGIA